MTSRASKHWRSVSLIFNITGNRRPSPSNGNSLAKTSPSCSRSLEPVVDYRANHVLTIRDCIYETVYLASSHRLRHRMCRLIRHHLTGIGPRFDRPVGYRRPTSLSGSYAGQPGNEPDRHASLLWKELSSQLDLAKRLSAREQEVIAALEARQTQVGFYL